MIGYLVAGVMLGPFLPGYVADGSLAGQLAEIGIMLMMFGVGLHFLYPILRAAMGYAVMRRDERQ